MSDQKKVFELYGGYMVRAVFYGSNSDFTVEDMYQAFEARLPQELSEHASNHGHEAIGDAAHE